MGSTARSDVEAGVGEWTATGHEPPVFLDERGRRRRWVLGAGSLAGVIAVIWLGALIAGGVGFTSLPSMRLPGGLSAALRPVSTLHARTGEVATRSRDMERRDARTRRRLVTLADSSEARRVHPVDDERLHRHLLVASAVDHFAASVRKTVTE